MLQKVPGGLNPNPSLDKLDYSKMDLDVWEFEPQSFVHVEEEALSLYEKSANATYCSQILSSFNLEETRY
jgi:hypothetical protein